MKLFKFTNGVMTVEFFADSYQMAYEMVPYGYNLFTITKIEKS